MNPKLAEKIARRLNEIKLRQPEDPGHPLFGMVDRWAREGGRLIVHDTPDGQIIDWYFPKVYRWES